ncbi:hypothetical protein [Meiothermus ruber]|uniref:hypothetical protein n=1 Tax=Meiothermus ruber TaxID=277 RepID=UPI00055A58BA|nr:hypothetical protein [Meiothermus ruber]
MTQPLSPKCPYCNGAGEYEHPAYRELDELWRKGRLFDEEGITHFWADRGFNPANPPLRYNACRDCGGTGDMDIRENLALEARALAAWRAAGNSLVDRLVALHQKNRELALALAYYTERYYGDRTEPGKPWPYQWLVPDVASWPKAVSEQCPSCSGSGRWGDDIPCGRCGGEGAVGPQQVI